MMKKGKQQSKYDRGQIVVKIIALLLAVIMLIAVGATALNMLFS